MCPRVKLIREDHVRISRRSAILELSILSKTGEPLRGVGHLHGELRRELTKGQRDLASRSRRELRSHGEDSSLHGER